MSKKGRKKLNSFWTVLVFLAIQTLFFLFFRMPFYLPLLVFLVFFFGFYLLVFKEFRGFFLAALIALWIFLSLILFFGLFYLNKKVFFDHKFLFAFLFFLCYFSTAVFLSWLADFGDQRRTSKKSGAR